MIILDTTFLVDYIRCSNKKNNNSPILNKFEYLLNSGEPCVTTFVNIFELHRGAYKSLKKERELEAIRTLMEEIVVLGFEENYYSEYGILSSMLEKNGNHIGTFDELIAAIALYNGAKVLTRNVKDFSRVPNLEVIPYP